MQYDSYSNSKIPKEKHPTLLTRKGGVIIDAENFSEVGSYIEHSTHTVNWRTNSNYLWFLVWFHLQGDIEEINRLYECNEI